jgi:hypothetical protein
MARHSDPEQTLWFVAIAIVVAVALTAWKKLSDRRRQRDLQELAQRMGWSYAPQGTVAEGPEPLHLFRRGHSHRLRNCLGMTSAEATVRVFDLRFVIGHGRHRRHQAATVIEFRSSLVRLPFFHVRPEGLGDKLAALIGRLRDIDLSEQPEFSRTHVLLGEDAAAIGALFSEDVVRPFQDDRRLSADGVGDRLLIYRWDRLLSPKDLAAFVSAAIPLCARFAARGAIASASRPV